MFENFRFVFHQLPGSHQASICRHFVVASNHPCISAHDYESQLRTCFQNARCLLLLPLPSQTRQITVFFFPLLRWNMAWPFLRISLPCATTSCLGKVNSGVSVCMRLFGRWLPRMCAAVSLVSPNTEPRLCTHSALFILFFSFYFDMLYIILQCKSVDTASAPFIAAKIGMSVPEKEQQRKKINSWSL